MSMTERRIGLDTGIAQGMPDLLRQGAGQARREASDADRRAFEQALADSGEGGAAEARGEADIQAATPRPFALFSGPAAPALQPADAPSGLAEDLAQAAERLLVGDGSSGRREVRIDLKDDVLPGVTLAVYEEEGRLVAAFTCASEASRERLNACAQALADELAQSLGRPARVRITTDDPEDPCLYEAASAA